MMLGTASRAYLRGDGYQAVLLPYRDINLAMAVLLPDGPLAALRPKVAAAGLGGLLAGAARHRVTLSLPRFRLEAAFNLIPALRRLGVARRSVADADFGEITEAAPLRIGAVAHKASVDVDEQGTEAAAATAVVIRTWPPCGRRPRSRWWWTGRSCSRSSTARPACRCSSARSATRAAGDQGFLRGGQRLEQRRLAAPARSTWPSRAGWNRSADRGWRDRRRA